MRIDKDDLCFWAIIGGLVLCSPFIALYHAGKWMYGMTPKGVKERKAKERKLEEMNQEIHELEKRLGLGSVLTVIRTTTPCISAISRKAG